MTGVIKQVYRVYSSVFKKKFLFLESCLESKFTVGNSTTCKTTDRDHEKEFSQLLNNNTALLIVVCL